MTSLMQRIFERKHNAPLLSVTTTTLDLVCRSVLWNDYSPLAHTVRDTCGHSSYLFTRSKVEPSLEHDWFNHVFDSQKRRFLLWWTLPTESKIIEPRARQPSISGVTFNHVRHRVVCLGVSVLAPRRRGLVVCGPGMVSGWSRHLQNTVD